jgi:hypothetical protein
VRKGSPKVKRKTMGEDKKTQTRPSTMADQVGVHEAPTTKKDPKPSREKQKGEKDRER